MTEGVGLVEKKNVWEGVGREHLLEREENLASRIEEVPFFSD